MNLVRSANDMMALIKTIRAVLMKWEYELATVNRHSGMASLKECTSSRTQVVNIVFDFPRSLPPTLFLRVFAGFLWVLSCWFGLST